MLQPTNRFFSPNVQCGIIPLMHSTVLFLSFFRRVCDLGSLFFRKTKCDVHIFFELFLLVIRLPSSPAADKLIHPQNDLDQFLGGSSAEKLGRMIPFFFFPAATKGGRPKEIKFSKKTYVDCSNKAEPSTSLFSQENFSLSTFALLFLRH